MARTTSFAGLALLIGAGFESTATAQPGAREPAPAPISTGGNTLGGAWSRMPVSPGGPVDTRPFPPKVGRDRCIPMNGIAGAQMFGDRAMELSMKNGRRYRLFFARECPALSFYQGFYYRRSQAGQLCAGRDTIGARSGGECPIASVIPVPSAKPPPRR